MPYLTKSENADMYVIFEHDSKRLVSDRKFAYLKVACRHADKYTKKYGVATDVMNYDGYMKSYGKMTKKVRNLMSGKEVEININTPRSCDPSSELYWSM